MKIQYLIEILILLLSREKVSAKYVADRFSISIRTAYRYFDELSLCVPIYNERGRNGGYSISKTYKIPSTYFGVDESDFLLNLLNGMNNEVTSPILQRIIDKLTSISKKPKTNLTIDFGNLVIDGGPWGNTDSYKETLTFLESCIENLKQITIDYRDREGLSSRREIEPHTIILKQGLWYCYAYCHLREGFRLFKVGRIEGANLTGKTFTRRSTDNLKDALKDWYESLDCEEMELILDPTVKADIEEWLGVDKVFTKANGEIIASASLPIDATVSSKILSYGNKVKVVAPLKLKEMVIQTAKAVTQLY